MNKKRVALALAAALGVNTLMVTVGNINGQVQVAHAQNARLTNPEGVTLAEVKTLDVKVDSVSNSAGKEIVTLSFNDLNKDEISDLTVSGLTGWSWENGQLKLEGLTNGVNTFTVNVSYKDSSKSNESYKVTLKKTSVEDQLTFTPKVEAASITLDNIQFGTTDLNGKTVELKKGTSSLTGTIASGSVTFYGVEGMQLNDVYDVIVKDQGNVVVKGQFVLVPQVGLTNGGVKVVSLTNATGKDAAIDTELEKDYGTVDFTSDKATGKVTFKVGNKEILSYNQTVDGQNYAGDITAALGANSLDLTVGAVTPDADKYVPTIQFKDVFVGGTNTKKTLYVGEYSTEAKVGNDVFSAPSIDLSTSITTIEYGKTTGNDSGRGFALVNKTPVDAPKNENINALQGSKLSIPYEKFSQGYQTVGVTFSVKDGKIAGSTLSQVEGAIKAQNETGKEWYTQVVRPTPSSVETSVIVSKDVLEGSAVTGKFDKNGTTTGQLIIDAKGAFAGKTATSLKDGLSVTGATAVSLLTFSDDQVVFNVEFKDQVPSEIDWRFNTGTSTFSNVFKTAGYEAVNAKCEVVNLQGSAKGVYLDVALSGLSIPTNSTVTLEKDNKTLGTAVVNGGKYRFEILNFDDLTTGVYDLKIVTTGTPSETYVVGVYVERNAIGIKITAEAASNSSATIKIDAFLNGQKPENIKSGKIQYRELTIDDKGTTDEKDDVVTKYGDWTDANVTFASGDFKEDPIPKTVTGLTAGKTYEFRVVYEYQAPNTSKVNVYSNISNKVKVLASSNNGTITGNGSSSSTTGTSTGSTTINVTTNNSTLTGTSASVTLPTSFRYDSSKTPVAVTFKYKDKDGKVVTETKEQFSNVTAKFNGDKVEVNGLVPGKNYDEITVDYTDNNGRTRSIILRNIQTSTTVESEKYLANVYEVVLSRPADEAGYHFHLDNLKNKKVSLREFLLNMLSEKEFIEKYKSTEEKIEGLYNAIVARSSDEAGKKFWVDEYKKVLAVYGSETTALKAIADRMVNENELKELADKMGVQW